MPVPPGTPRPSEGLPSGGVFTFGAYKLDVHARRLFRNGQHVLLRGRQFEVLLVLVCRAGELVGKDELIHAAWDGAAIGDNTLNQTISKLRDVLDPTHPDRFIVTVYGHGYRFVAPVERDDAPAKKGPGVDLQALIAPYKAWLEGRAALDTLRRDQLLVALPLLKHLVATDSSNASFLVGLAMTQVLLFESTRTDPAADRSGLEQAISLAEEACRLKPDYAEAWATLGFALFLVGRHAEGQAALRRSTELQPNNWRLHVRLAACLWGEERLRAVEAALALLPDCPMARWLAATVFVARGALAQAEAEVDAGIAAMPDTPTDGQPWAVALHWLKGLLCLARGAVDEALAAFRRELAFESLGHIYGREIAANAWYATGAALYRAGQRNEARAAFEEARARVPGHHMAQAGLALLAPQGERLELPPPTSVDHAFAHAAVLVGDDDAARGAAVVMDAIASALPGNSGWLLPIEPLLGVPRNRSVWTSALAVLKARAS